MDEVASGLFVGTIADAGDESALCTYDITAIVALSYDDPEGGYPSKQTIVAVPMVDGPQNDPQTFGAAVQAVRSRLDAGTRILVHCSAGASRSPAVAATALALDGNRDLEEAFQQVLERREAADPHQALVRQAARCYATLGEYTDRRKP
ncbi:MAG: atypical dual specificity phosphatase [Haloarculaceae archaeon]|jgi:atypical dual specificity phosphatase